MSPYGTELDVETMAQIQLPTKYNTLVNISYKVYGSDKNRK